jgi:hypothetical protein
VWNGYIESYKFPSGSDAMVMNVSLSGTTVTGTLVFGGAPAAPAPTDPNVGYPPGYGSGMGGGNTFGFAGEGFVYTIEQGHFDGSRFTFGVSTHELWSAWCKLQTTTYLQQQGTNLYQCLPNWGFSSGPTGCSQPNPQTGQSVPVDCGKLALCQMQMVCQCTATGCSLDPAMSVDVTFDMVVAPPKADGSTTGAFSDHNVHFTHA